MPPRLTPKHAIVRRYQEDMAASGWSDYSLPSLEGYINARVAAEDLRRAGAGVTLESLIAALDRIGALDLGGLRVSFGKGNRIGGNFVDVAVIGQDGSMLCLTPQRPARWWASGSTSGHFSASAFRLARPASKSLPIRLSMLTNTCISFEM